MERVHWTVEDKANLAAHYPAIPAKELSKLIEGRTEKAIFRMAQKMGLRKNQERLAECGRESVSRRKDRQCAFLERQSPFKAPEVGSC